MAWCFPISPKFVARAAQQLLNGDHPLSKLYQKAEHAFYYTTSSFNGSDPYKPCVYTEAPHLAFPQTPKAFYDITQLATRREGGKAKRNCNTRPGSLIVFINAPVSKTRYSDITHLLKPAQTTVCRLTLPTNSMNSVRAETRCWGHESCSSRPCHTSLPQSAGGPLWSYPYPLFVPVRRLPR